MTDDPRVQMLLDELLASDATPEEVCRGCPDLLPEVRTRWRRVCQVRAELDALFPTGSETTPPGPPSEAVELPSVPGYEIEGVLGRGGMGVVYKARHLALKRTVALKVLPRDRGRQADRARLEAEAVARLQHPNVVQIYEVGEADGRPFFALELVEGGSLASRLGGRPLPPRDAARLVATLAEAMHFAHSRNLVHRDLKPGNVLLEGAADAPVAQSRPKVADFGLARFLDADAGQPRIGMVLGTPSYMAPEQADGRADSAGPAADVHALGAILYECLSGRPPFHGATRRQTLEQVRGQEPAPPSSLNSRVPRDLEMICLKCLRKQPERRYSSARELADDLGRFVRGEPVAARPVGQAERAWKWVRRRPTAAGLLTAVTLLVAAVAGGAWLIHDRRATAQTRQAQTDQEARAILGPARVKLEDGWNAANLARLTEAQAEGARAEDVARSGGASMPVRQEAEAFREDADRRLARAWKNRVLLEALVDLAGPQDTYEHARDESGQMRSSAGRAIDEQSAAAFQHWGLDVDGTAEAEVVARLAAEPEPVVQELIAALDAWALWRRQNRPGADWPRLFRVVDQLDRSNRRQRFRASVLGGDPPEAEVVAGMVGARSPWLALWELKRGVALRRLQKLGREIDPRTEPVLTVVLLANLFVAVKDAASAEEVLVRASTARPGQMLLLHRLGNLLAEQGPSRLEEAIGCYRAARSLRPRWGVGLSAALVRAGRPAQAEAVMHELLSQQPDHPEYRAHLGYALMAQRRFGEAEVAYRKVIALDPEYGEAHNDLGSALAEQGKYASAEVCYRRALALRPGLHDGYSNLGVVLVEQGKGREAEEALRQAISIRPELARSHYNLGRALGSQGKYPEAERALRQAIVLWPDFAEAHRNLGRVLAGQGKYAAAEAAYRKALALRPTSAHTHFNLAELLRRLGQHREEEESYRQAIALWPAFAEAHYNLGKCLALRGKHDEAAAAYRAAIAHRHDYTDAHINLSLSLWRTARFDEAGVQLLELDRLLPPKDARRGAVRQLRDQCQRLALLDKKLPAILEGTQKPASAAERLEFRQVCHSKQLYAAAARFARDAFVAEPRLAADVATGTRYDAACAAALAGAGQGKDAADLDDAERARWRRQALQWLRLDLAWWGKVLEGGKGQSRAQVRAKLQHWVSDGDFAGVRDKDALARLPEEERGEWGRFWAEVEALIRRASKPD